jgi:hypothetical protein
MPGMPGEPSGADLEKASEYHPVWAYAYLEQRKRPKVVTSADGKHTWAIIEHKWGKPVYVPLEAITAYIQAPPLAKRWESRLKASKDDMNADRLLALAEWALERGLLAEFHKVIDELKEVDANNAALKRIEQTRAALKATPAQDDPTAAALARELGDEGYRPVRSEQGHYTLLTNAKGGAEDEAVKRRLARMEDTYQVFFYWFALKGSPRTVPAYRLVTVLVKEPDPENTKEFDSKHAFFDQLPMLADGFTVRRDNVVVLSSRRTDEAFTTLLHNNKQLFQSSQFKVRLQDLLGDAKLLEKRRDIAGYVPALQTLALMQVAMQEESEWATVTHECVRQLEAATNLIPRNVNAAEWAQFGLASFFETSHRSFYPAHGAPNWNQLINFKFHFPSKTKKKEPHRARDVLLNVITDRYFRQGYELLREQTEVSDDKDKEKDSLTHRTTDLLEKARSTSWALTYYLAHHHLDKLLAYYQELSKLPRDLEYDEGVLRDCFGRAFKLLTADPNDPRKQVLDLARVEALANDWFNKMDMTMLDMVEVEQEGLRSRLLAGLQATAPKTATNPQQPGTGQFPGGRPPYGPGMGGMGRPPFGPPGGRPPGGRGPGGGKGPGGY